MVVSKLRIVLSSAALLLATVAVAQTTPAPAGATKTQESVTAPAAAPQTTARLKKGPPDPKAGGTPAYVKPETPEQRKARLGTAEDPGLDPDQNKKWFRFGKWFHIEKFDRRFARYDGYPEGWCRPVGMVNLEAEIYQQNAAWVWAWIPEPVEEAPPAEIAKERTRYGKVEIDFFNSIKPEFAVINPPKSTKAIRFEESSAGLPKSGSWRNSVAVADMNGDGFPDIIAPPQRGSSTIPEIFLGDGKGHWHAWEGVVWDHGLSYGSVVAADFNKDGHMDLAFGAHLNGVYIFLGDGKGRFKEVTDGFKRDFGTRRVRIADVDGDGWPDVVAITEGPMGGMALDGGPLRAYLNRKKGTSFQSVNIVPPGVKTGGDWLSIGNFNGDKIPDFALGSVYFSAVEILYLSEGPLKWGYYNRQLGWDIPTLAYYLGNAAGQFSSKGRDDAILSYARYWPGDLDPLILAAPEIREFTSIDRFTLGKDGTMKRTPIIRWAGADDTRGLAAGDFDGDGNLDIVYTHSDPREAVILLGDGKGGFTRAAVEGVPLHREPNYDITVADVNGDGLPDLVMAFETLSTRNALAPKTGSIRVFLNRGPVAGTPTTAASN